MNISSTLLNSYLNEASHLTSTRENLDNPSMVPSTNEQFYHDYQCNSTPISILNYPEYSTNDHNISNDHIPYQPSLSVIDSQEQMVSTIKIHINPFFRLHSSHQTNESSSDIDKDRSASIEQQHNSSLSSRSRSRSRSPSSERQVIISSNKKRHEHQIRKIQREKFLQEKELIFKRQSSLLFSKSKFRRSSPCRWEHKEEQLKCLYKEYSDEDTYKQWKPLLLKECFELYEYAFDKYHGTSIDN